MPRPTVLKRMRRPAAQEKTLERIRALARDLPRPDASARPSSSAFPARPRRISPSCSTGSTRPSSTASAASNTSRCAARRRTILPTAVPDEVKQQRWDRFMQRAAEDLGAAAEAQGRHAAAGHHRRDRAPQCQGPHQGRRAGDRRRGPCRQPPAVARRRNRHREDRARRRLRSARHRGRVLGLPGAGLRRTCVADIC